MITTQWREEDIKRIGNASPSIDNLRYAIIGAETKLHDLNLNKNSREPMTQQCKIQQSKVLNDEGSDNSEVCFRGRNTQYERMSEIDKAPIPKQSYGEFSELGHEARETHPSLFELQRRLLKAFPMCDEQNTKSEEGFVPHMTLGQCLTKDVEGFIAELKKQWRDFYYTVESVRIIYRQREGHRFHERETINLCN